MSLIKGTYSNISAGYRGFSNWDNKGRLNSIDVEPFREDREFPVNFTGRGRKSYQASITPVRNTKVPPTKALIQNQLSARSLTKPNLLTKFNKERDFFIKVIDHKIKSEFTLTEGYPISMNEIKTLFSDLHYELNGKQLNDLFLKSFDAGRKFQSKKLFSWIKSNFHELETKQEKAFKQ